MSSHTMDTLRGHLFDALDGLKTGTLDVSVARAMSGVAQTIIESAKAEAAPIERQKIATGTLERQGNVTRHIAR